MVPRRQIHNSFEGGNRFLGEACVKLGEPHRDPKWVVAGIDFQGSERTLNRFPVLFRRVHAHNQSPMKGHGKWIGLECHTTLLDRFRNSSLWQQIMHGVAVSHPGWDG